LVKIKKAVIPVAGLGTRLLPITKSMPKEMLPLLDKPVIHYVVEEAMKAGLDDILLIIGKGKRAIVDYFDRSFDLEYLLKLSGKNEKYCEIEEIGELVDLHYVQQKIPLGLGDAILHAKKHVNDEPFAVLLGDDVILNEKPAILQLIKEYNRHNCSIVGTELVKREEVTKYGIVSGTPISEGLIKINNMVEKPTIKESPSNLAIIGRYILKPSIFSSLESIKKGKNNELQLTDALFNLIKKNKCVMAKKIRGIRFDIGDVPSYISANVRLALMDDRYKNSIKNLLSSIE
jgi:UTP--glucose-1-phosphate uridylyltransferase